MQVMRTDTNISCTTDKHAEFKRMAGALICVVGAGVPITWVLWIRYLRGSAHAGNVLERPMWRGLGDPTTRGGWGGLYEMVRVNVMPCACDCCVPLLTTSSLRDTV
jgi:hypothetical protein